MKQLLTLIFLCTSFFVSAQKAERSEEQALQLIDSIYTALTNGADFASLATRYSEDPGSAKKGGMYLNCSKGQFVAPFEEATLSLSVGGLSKPFKTQYGYHVVQLMVLEGDHFSVRHILVKFKT